MAFLVHFVAAITKCHRLGGLNNSNLFLKAEVRDQSASIVKFSGGHCFGFQTADFFLYPHGRKTRVEVSSLMILFFFFNINVFTLIGDVSLWQIH